MREVHIGEWGRLVVYEPDEEVPGLAGAEPFWRGDERRRPVVLKTGGRNYPYVAVWPADGPPPPEGKLTEFEIEGVVLAEPRTVLRCFSCGAEMSGLYAESGLPFFRPRDRQHNWLRACPACGAPVDRARLHGVLPVNG